MKKIACLFGFLLVAACGQAQESARRRPALPFTFSLFSESVSLPTLRGSLRKPNPGCGWAPSCTTATVPAPSCSRP